MIVGKRNLSGGAALDVFISYSRENRDVVERLVGAVMQAGYTVWWDKDVPPHLSYADVITQQIKESKAAIVIWSGGAGSSQWVRAEADLAREHGKLIQASVDGTTPPLPFNQIQFVSIADWQGEADHPGWLKIRESLLSLCGPGAGAPIVPSQPPAPVPTQPPAPPPTSPPIAPPAASQPPSPFPTTPPSHTPAKGGSPVILGIIILSVAVLLVVGILTWMRSRTTPAGQAAATKVEEGRHRESLNDPANGGTMIVPQRLVTLGGPGPYQAACRRGQVSGLDPNGDNFLALRTRPGADGLPLEELGPGRRVLVCDSGSAQGRAWVGIVYGPDDPGRACGVRLPDAAARPYRGPCNSGWVSASFVALAGE
jgi:hypothetical protein